MTKRKRFSPAERASVHAKFGGRCAYCGREIPLKQMQIDHLVPVDRDGSDLFANLMPSCRLCNYYKSYHPLEAFRHDLSTLLSRIRKPFIYRLGAAYGMVFEKPWDNLFYFEKLAEK